MRFGQRRQKFKLCQMREIPAHGPNVSARPVAERYPARGIHITLTRLAIAFSLSLFASVAMQLPQQVPFDFGTA